jgi:leucyl aminopeptidase
MSLAIAVRTGRPGSANTPMLACFLAPGDQVAGPLKELDSALGGAIRRSVDRRDFRGGRDETLHIVGGRRGPRRVLLVGLGKAADRGPALRRAAALAARQAHRAGVGALTMLGTGWSAEELERALVGAQLGAWEYLDRKSPPPAEDRRAPLAELTVLVDDAKAVADALSAARALGHGYALARRLANMAGNDCTPDVLADAARTLGKAHKLKVVVLGRKEMEREKMGSFLCVAQATPQDPKLVAIEYLRGAKGDAPIVLVGKGLCFDTGGISLKPAERMEFMKFDMCGAAGVLGAMDAIARMNLRINVIGVFGATTNMPGANAVKPGDIVQASSGKTIEIINTDAEGRLVLADVLHWVKRYSPAAVVDAATLTGACVVALGNTTTGAMGNDDSLVEDVLAASRRASEPAWQLPLSDEYKEQIRSVVADIKNTGGRAAGALTAAAFLNEFVDYPWVHLDIAGTAYTESDLTIMPVGATGVPVGTFVEFVRGRAS